MAAKLPQPNTRESIADGQGKPTATYVKFINRLVAAIQSQLDGLQSALDSITGLEGSAANLAQNKADKTTRVDTAGSLIGGGDLSTDHQLALLNDSESPGASYVYGTNGSGTKGWFPGSGYGSGGTVTSVALSLPAAVFDVAGSPITGAGTFTVTLDTQSANTVFSGPTTGSPATPTFRALVAADIPSLPVSKLLQSGASTNDVLTWNGSAWVPATPAAAGQSGIQFEDEGSNLGTSGTVTEVDFVGSGVTATRASNKVTVTIPGGGSVAVVTDSTTSRTAALTDADKLIEFTNAAATTYTIPPQSSVAWAADTVLYAAQGNTGQVTFVAGSGVTIETPDSLKSRAQESIIGVKRMAADRWEAFGDLELFATAASVYGRSASTNGAPGLITAGSDGVFLGRSSGALSFFAVTDALLSTSDITTNNVSTTKHGFAPKLPGVATQYLDGTGNYSTPAGGGGGGTGTTLGKAIVLPMIATFTC